MAADRHGRQRLRGGQRLLGLLADRNYSPRTGRSYGYDLLAFCRWLCEEGLTLEAVTTESLLGYLRACREAAVPDRPSNVVSLLGVRADRYAPTTINHRLAAVTGLFAFRTMRDPTAANPVPKGREARRVTAAERNGLLGHLATRPKQRSALRLREPRRLPRALDRRETTDLLGSLRTWRDRAIAGLMLFSGLRSCEVLALDVTDVDIGGRWLRVTGKGAKERRVPLDVRGDPDLPAGRAPGHDQQPVVRGREGTAPGPAPDPGRVADDLPLPPREVRRPGRASARAAAHLRDRAG